MILLEQDLISQHDIENKVCPILLALSAPDSDDEYKAEAVNVSLSRERQPHTLVDGPELGVSLTGSMTGVRCWPALARTWRRAIWPRPEKVHSSDACVF